ncbi:hypothetical protein EV368DRAFT_27695, partial [Lentinula lateritia]
GGSKLLYAMQKAYRLPSLTTLHRNRPLPKLICSICQPTKAEVEANIAAFFHPDVIPSPELKEAGWAIMIDDIALDEIPRYDTEHDHILGFSRESVYTTKYNLKLKNYDMILDLQQRMESTAPSTQLKLANKATVVVIAPLAQETHYA